MPIKVVQKSFKFNNSAIKTLKVDGASEMVPNPSSFEAVTGFVWKHVMDAIQTTNNNNNELVQPIPNLLCFAASLRSRANPPLPKQSMGNIITQLRARFTYGDGSSGNGDQILKEIIREIHAPIQTLNQIVETLKDEEGAEAYIANKRVSDNKNCSAEMSSTFNVTSWYKLGFNDVDFGFGPPIKNYYFAIIYPFHKNSMKMIDYSDGIEVFVCLEDIHMSSLESNTHFMALAARG
ncbi:hypothetical protein vseg_016708 [Gypsophila vaccaria]